MPIEAFASAPARALVPPTRRAPAALRLPARAPTDDELMCRVQQGDTDAFGQLYDRHARHARRIAMATCGGPAAAEDAVQAAFISIWTARTSYRPRLGGFTSWAMTIVRNRAIDLARRSARERRLSDAAQLERQMPSADPAADVIARDDARRLRARLACLPATQREVIALAFFGNLTYAEIAEHLSLPPGTVKGRARLGMQKLAYHDDWRRG